MRSFSTRTALTSLAIAAFVLHSPALAKAFPTISLPGGGSLQLPGNIPPLPGGVTVSPGGVTAKLPGGVTVSPGGVSAQLPGGVTVSPGGVTAQLPGGVTVSPGGISGLPANLPKLPSIDGPIWTMPDGLTGGGANANASGVTQYEAQGSFVKDIMNGYVKRSAAQSGAYGTDNAVTDKLTLPPLPGEQAMADSSNDTTRFAPNGKLPMTSRESYEDFQIRMPTLIGMRQLMDGTPIKDMLKELTTKQVPVLFQTMMMVENGAATGYIGALNATNGILQNTMQSQDLQIKLMDLTDHTGLQKEAYLRRMKQALEDPKTNDAWPAALFAATGDMATEANGKIADFKVMPDAKGFSVGNLRGSPSVDASKVILSDLLFYDQDVAENVKESLTLLKRDFRRYLGDYEIEQLPIAGKTAGVTIKMKRIKPEAANNRRGLARAKWEEQAVVFESLGRVLKLHCEFKRNNTNNQARPFTAETAGQYLQGVMDHSTASPSRGYMGSSRHSPWEYASSPDIPLTLNFIEQLYTLFNKAAREQDLRCEEFSFSAANIPSIMSAERSSNNLDDCSAGKSCVRNRLLVFYSDVVARSRVLYLYRTLIEQVYKFAVTPELYRYLTQMLREEFGDYDINQEISLNQQRWSEYQIFLAKYAQSLSGGGSAPITGVGDNVPNAFVPGKK